MPVRSESGPVREVCQGGDLLLELDGHVLLCWRLRLCDLLYKFLDRSRKVRQIVSQDILQIRLWRVLGWRNAQFRESHLEAL